MKKLSSMRPTKKSHKYTPLKKAELGMFLDAGELAEVLGFHRNTIGRWRRMGLPLINRKITREDALTWLKSNRKLVNGASQHEDQPSSGECISCEQAQTNDSQEPCIPASQLLHELIGR